MTFLSFSFTFDLLAVFHGVLYSKFKLCDFCCQYTHQGGYWETKWSVPWFECDESLTWHGLNSNPGHFCGSTTIYLVWRITFACFVVCRWQVWHGGQRWGSRQKYETWCRESGIVKHMSDTRWPDDWEVRWRCVWSALCTMRRWVRVSLVWPQNQE
jgi:hypothetical protein